MADEVVWLRKRLVGGGECIGEFLRTELLRGAGTVEVPEADIETEYPADRDAADPVPEGGAIES